MSKYRDIDTIRIFCE